MLDEQQMDARDTTGISVIVSASAGAVLHYFLILIT
jgi:hypothetical protein